MSATATEISPAQQQAEHHWQANFAALPDWWKQRLTGLQMPAGQWVWGRDGSLTMKMDTPDGPAWLSGTGLPRRVAESTSQTAITDVPALCLAGPAQAQIVRVLLDRLGMDRPLWCVIRDAADAMAILHGDDFSAELAGGALQWVGADSLASDIEQITTTRPGVVVPLSIFKASDTTFTDAEADVILPQIGEALSAAQQSRQSAIERFAATPPAATDGRLVVAPSRFRLWADAGRVLGGVAQGEQLDTDRCDSASVRWLAEQAAGANVIVAADLMRSDLPGAIHPGRTMVSWLSRPRAMVPFTGGRDAIVVPTESERERWISAGWPSERTVVGGWPSRVESRGEGVLLAIDLGPSVMPEGIERMSSWAVLWKQIQAELIERPFALHAAGGVEAYLADRSGQVGATSVPTEPFKFGCIEPAFIRGLGRFLREKVGNVHIAGRGWGDDVSPITEAGQLKQVLSESRLIIDPTLHGHAAIRTCGVPVVSAIDRSASELIAALRGQGVADTAVDLKEAIEQAISSLD